MNLRLPYLVSWWYFAANLADHLVEEPQVAQAQLLYLHHASKQANHYRQHLAYSLEREVVQVDQNVTKQEYPDRLPLEVSAQPFRQLQPHYHATTLAHPRLALVLLGLGYCCLTKLALVRLRRVQRQQLMRHPEAKLVHRLHRKRWQEDQSNAQHLLPTQVKERLPGSAQLPHEASSECRYRDHPDRFGCFQMEVLSGLCLTMLVRLAQQMG
jgi:hypothetical protein